MSETATEIRTVWHPALPEDDPDRYRNVPSTAEERARLDLFYDRFGSLRERRGTPELENEWGADVMRCIFGEGSCGRMWTDTREAHCAGCHAHFGGNDGFDRHLDVNDGACRNPVTIDRLRCESRKFGPTWIKRLVGEF